jgi:DNA-binding SARP family transcriptional activator
VRLEEVSFLSQRLVPRSEAGLHLRLLGGFRGSVDGRAIDDGDWRLRKAKSLVKLLTLSSGHALHREQLADALWQDLSSGAAANNLRKALHLARRALEPDAEGSSRYLALQDDLLVLRVSPASSFTIA